MLGLSHSSRELGVHLGRLLPGVSNTVLVIGIILSLLLSWLLELLGKALEKPLVGVLRVNFWGFNWLDEAAKGSRSGFLSCGKLILDGSVNKFVKVVSFIQWRNG